MDRITNARIALSTSVVALVIGASGSLELGAQWFSNSAEFLIRSIFGIAAGLWIGELIIRSDRARQAILGADYIEGFWEVTTRPSASDVAATDHDLLRNGVLHLYFDKVSGKYRVVTTRIGKDGQLFRVVSEAVHIRKDDANLRYLNYFRIHNGRGSAEFGISHGTFLPSSISDRPVNKIEAEIFTAGSAAMYQVAVKISDSKVKKFQEKYGSEWPERYLNERIRNGSDSGFTALDGQEHSEPMPIGANSTISK